jgi:hypothetical protein
MFTRVNYGKAVALPCKSYSKNTHLDVVKKRYLKYISIKKSPFETKGLLKS